MTPLGRKTPAFVPPRSVCRTILSVVSTRTNRARHPVHKNSPAGHPCTRPDQLHSHAVRAEEWVRRGCTLDGSDGPSKVTLV